MTTLEDAREQLLSQIEMELCRIYPAGNMAPDKLKEFYDYVASLDISNPVFSWYLMNMGRIRIQSIVQIVHGRMTNIKKYNSVWMNRA